jgi:hypothetical protein
VSAHRHVPCIDACISRRTQAGQDAFTYCVLQKDETLSLSYSVLCQCAAKDVSPGDITVRWRKQNEGLLSPPDGSVGGSTLTVPHSALRFDWLPSLVFDDVTARETAGAGRKTVPTSEDVFGDAEKGGVLNVLQLDDAASDIGTAVTQRQTHVFERRGSGMFSQDPPNGLLTPEYTGGETPVLRKCAETTFSTPVMHIVDPPFSVTLLCPPLGKVCEGTKVC